MYVILLLILAVASWIVMYMFCKEGLETREGIIEKAFYVLMQLVYAVSVSNMLATWSKVFQAINEALRLL